MTNRVALVLGLVIIGAILLDALVFGGIASMFLLRKMAVLIEWLAFWR